MMTIDESESASTPLSRPQTTKVNKFKVLFKDIKTKAPEKIVNVEDISEIYVDDGKSQMSMSSFGSNGISQTGEKKAPRVSTKSKYSLTKKQSKLVERLHAGNKPNV